MFINYRGTHLHTTPLSKSQVLFNTHWEDRLFQRWRCSFWSDLDVDSAKIVLSAMKKGGKVIRLEIR